MRPFVIVALLLAFVSCTAAAKCDDGLDDKVAAALGYGASYEGDGEFSRCKAMPSQAGKSIVVVVRSNVPSARPAGEEEDRLDLDVVIAESGSGKVLARYHQDKAITSDAFVLRDVTIDTARYDVTAQDRAFGVRWQRETSSRISQGASESTNLFVQDGTALRRIVGGLETAGSSGEWDGDCEGTFSNSTRTISIDKGSHGGYRDLVVRESIAETRNVMAKDDECQEVPQPAKTRQVVLTFDGKAYAVPRGMEAVE